jgi:hypothetical protein
VREWPNLTTLSARQPARVLADFAVKRVIPGYLDNVCKTAANARAQGPGSAALRAATLARICRDPFGRQVRK